MSDYTPDEEEITSAYAASMSEWAGEMYDVAKADAVRGIAKVKADTLREAVKALPRPVGLNCNTECHSVDWASLRLRAERIEWEA